jgi:SAM-dependent methyltransferase
MSIFEQSNKVDYVIRSDDVKNISNVNAKKWWNKIADGENEGWNKSKSGDKNIKTNYFVNRRYGHSNPNLLDRIESTYLNNLDSMLEIGPGYGRETSEFIKRYNQVYTIEIADAHNEIIKADFSNVISNEYDGINIPHSNDMFDLVYSCFVLQHTSKKNAINLLNESIRVLRPGGIFVHEFLSGQYCGGTNNDHLSGGTLGMFNNGYYKEEVESIVENLDNCKIIECNEKILVTEGDERGLGNIWLVCQKI